jgi:hypothetical protein
MNANCAAPRRDGGLTPPRKQRARKAAGAFLQRRNFAVEFYLPISFRHQLERALPAFASAAARSPTSISSAIDFRPFFALSISLSATNLRASGVSIFSFLHARSNAAVMKAKVFVSSSSI